MSEEHRVKIQNSNILNALIEHAVGTRDMSSTQVTAAIALMKKIMPDLAAMDISGSLDHDVDVTVSGLAVNFVRPKPTDG
jgi:hypothetical protein